MRSIGEVINAAGGSIGEAVAAVKSGKKTSVFGLTKSDVLLFCTAFDKFLLVCADVVAARTAFVELSLHYPSAELLLPKNNVLLISGARENSGMRARALYNIASGKSTVVVTTAEALMQIVPPRAFFTSAAVTFKVGQKERTDAIISRLTAAGYVRCGHVDEPCTFSVRGDILDVCAPSGEAARIEFFGYECDSVRVLDIASQSAGARIDEFTAYPATETPDAEPPSSYRRWHLSYCRPS